MAANVRKYRKTAPVEAVQLTQESRDDVVDWITSNGAMAWASGVGITIETLEGPIDYGLFYWIVRNETGEFYGVADDRFVVTYTLVEGDE